MSKWKCSNEPDSIQMIPVPLEAKHYDQLLAEIAEILYQSYCQFQKIDPIKSIETQSACPDMATEKRAS